MKRKTFEHIQNRYANMCNLYWFRLKELYDESGLTKVNFEQLYYWEKKDSALLEYKAIMDELFYICCLEGNKNIINDRPTAYFAEKFMHKFYNEIYQSGG